MRIPAAPSSASRCWRTPASWSCSRPRSRRPASPTTFAARPCSPSCPSRWKPARPPPCWRARAMKRLRGSSSWRRRFRPRLACLRRGPGWPRRRCPCLRRLDNPPTNLSPARRSPRPRRSLNPRTAVRRLRSSLAPPCWPCWYLRLSGSQRAARTKAPLRPRDRTRRRSPPGRCRTRRRLHCPNRHRSQLRKARSMSCWSRRRLRFESAATPNRPTTTPSCTTARSSRNVPRVARHSRDCNASGPCSTHGSMPRSPSTGSTTPRRPLHSSSGSTATTRPSPGNGRSSSSCASPPRLTPGNSTAPPSSSATRRRPARCRPPARRACAPTWSVARPRRKPSARRRRRRAATPSCAHSTRAVSPRPRQPVMQARLRAPCPRSRHPLRPWTRRERARAPGRARPAQAAMMRRRLPGPLRAQPRRRPHHRCAPPISSARATLNPCTRRTRSRRASVVRCVCASRSTPTAV